MTRDRQDIVVIGSGIVGLSTAYYLLTISPSSRVTVLESSTTETIAGGASSYAGGFIAGGASWHNVPSQDLARESWKSHLELAKLLDGSENFGWRECGAIGLSVGDPVNRSAYRTLPGGTRKEIIEADGGKLPPGEWVEGEKEELSLEGGVGQVDPLEFCQTLFKYLTTTFPDRFSIRFGRAISIRRPSSLSEVLPESLVSSRSILTFSPYTSLDGPSSSPIDKPSSSATIVSSSSTIDVPFDKIVVAAGPWSAQVCDELKLPPIPITNLPGHSLLIRPSLDSYIPPSSTSTSSPVSSDHVPKELPSGAVFAGIDGGVGGVHGDAFGLARGLSEEEKRRGYTRAPEFFVRKNGLIFVAGENSIPESAAPSSVGLPNKLPPTVDEVKGMIDAECVGRLKRAAGAVSPFLKEENGAIVERSQFCYRPISSDREPIVGFIEESVLVATGHGPWGITLAPGTGKVVAEMVFGHKLSANVDGLSPARFGIGVGIRSGSVGVRSKL